MNVLVINSGSSSLKYQLIEMDSKTVLCKGLCERIGIEGSVVTHKAHGKEWKVVSNLPSHAEAFSQMLELMTIGESAVVEDKDDIVAIGHRVVHGGEKFSGSVLITEEVIEALDKLSELAPLHNPPQVQGIRSAQKVFGKDIVQVAVFDTAFHQTMPDYAYIFSIPYEYYEKYSVRRYGFHGTSHRYVSEKAAEYLGKPASELKIITCHLGNGSSITAVDGGKSVDTTMGLTPLGGITMGTRCGDLDPSVVTYICETTNIDVNSVNDILNKQSGFLGISGISSDNRDIEKGMELGDKRAHLAHNIFTYQLKKYIGSFAAAMGGLDAVVFTGGIGENSYSVRSDACKGLEFLGIKIDEDKNLQRGDLVDFSAPDARVKTIIIATDEELVIAEDTVKFV